MLSQLWRRGVVCWICSFLQSIWECASLWGFAMCCKQGREKYLPAGSGRDGYLDHGKSSSRKSYIYIKTILYGFVFLIFTIENKGIQLHKNANGASLRDSCHCPFCSAAKRVFTIEQIPGFRKVGLSFHFVRILPGVKNICDINIFPVNPVDYFIMAYN